MAVDLTAPPLRYSIWKEFAPRDRTESIVHNVQKKVFQYMAIAEHLGASPLGGRPTKYRPEFCELAFRMLADRSAVFSLRMVAAVLGISPDTMYRWKRLHPNFSDAVHMGKAVQEEWLANRLINNQGNARGLMFLLKRLHGWSDHGKEQKEPFDILKAIIAVETSKVAVNWDSLPPPPPQTR